MFAKITLILLVFLAVTTQAQEIIFIQAPGASSLDFNEVAKHTKGVQSILDLHKERIQKNPLQEEKFFTLGEQLGRPAAELILEIENFHKMAPLTEVSLNFLKDLSEKVLAGNLKTSENTFFKNLSCQSQLLTEDAANVSCRTSKVDLSALRRQWPQAQVLMLEGKMIPLEDLTLPPEILPSSLYHWILLSNTAQSLSFYGTYEHFLQQRLIMENYIDGTCQGFSANVDDFQIASKALVFFSKDCSKRLQRPLQKTSFAEWIDNNKKWVYPLGGVILGGVIFATQGKTLVIDRP